MYASCVEITHRTPSLWQHHWASTTTVNADHPSRTSERRCLWLVLSLPDSGAEEEVSLSRQDLNPSRYQAEKKRKSVWRNFNRSRCQAKDKRKSLIWRDLKLIRYQIEEDKRRSLWPDLSPYRYQTKDLGE